MLPGIVSTDHRRSVISWSGDGKAVRDASAPIGELCCPVDQAHCCGLGAWTGDHELVEVEAELTNVGVALETASSLHGHQPF